MTVIRKLGWSALVLAMTAFAGCGNQESGTTTPPASDTTAPVTGTPAPETPPAAAPAATPGETKPEANAGTTSPGTATDALPKGEPPAIEAPTPTPATKDEEKKTDDKAAAVSLSTEEVAEIKKLPAGEAEQALKQSVCPVSGENLGGMGVPVKVSAEGQTFFLCCKGCNKELKADPAAVVAKLKK